MTSPISALVSSNGLITSKCYARAGFIGNPSDGFFGKTIAVSVHNWVAEVTIWESPDLVLEPIPISDLMNFDSLDQLHAKASTEGYYGGLRLLYATCKRFQDACTEHGVELPARNFSLRYKTTIPRGLGLAGSSAIITATLRALMRFFGVEGQIGTKAELANLVLSVETQELSLTAGLQDRVIQVYGGAVYMDFDRELMERQGHGNYEPLDPGLFPPMFIAMVADPSDSSGMHSPVRVRWERGDQEVIEAMRNFADLASRCRVALEAGDWAEVGRLVNANFDLRRRLYGDAALGAANIEMIELARAAGAPAKFTGSGGAIMGLYRDDAHYAAIEARLTAHGYRVVRADIN